MAPRPYTFASCFAYECISADDSTPFETICYENVRMLKSIADISEGEVFECVYFDVQKGIFRFYRTLDTEDSEVICNYASIVRF